MVWLEPELPCSHQKDLRSSIAIQITNKERIVENSRTCRKVRFQ